MRCRYSEAAHGSLRGVLMKQISEAVWEIEPEGKMRVPALVFGTQKIVEQMKRDRSFSQLKNVATLPGIVKQAMVMPDGHEGYF